MKTNSILYMLLLAFILNVLHCANLDSNQNISALDSSPINTSQTQSPIKKHSFLIGLGFHLGNRIVNIQKTFQIDTLPNNIHSYDGNLEIYLGGIFNFHKSHSLRYTIALGYTNLKFHDDNLDLNFKLYNGFVYGANLTYIWNFAHHKFVDWGILAGLKYAGKIYAKSGTNLYLYDLNLSAGLGINIATHYRIELVFAIPIYSKFYAQNTNGKYFDVYQEFKHFQGGLNLLYYF